MYSGVKKSIVVYHENKFHQAKGGGFLCVADCSHRGNRISMIDNKVIVATDAARVSVEYANKMNVSRDEALQIFFGSATYRALIDVETGLCFEMFEAIYDMFLEEMGEQ